MHSELSEALEALRHDIKKGEKGWIGEEFADCVIRIFDTCEFLGINLEFEILDKMQKNANRSYMNGGKKMSENMPDSPIDISDSTINDFINKYETVIIE